MKDIRYHLSVKDCRAIKSAGKWCLKSRFFMRADCAFEMHNFFEDGWNEPFLQFQCLDRGGATSDDDGFGWQKRKWSVKK